MTEPTRQGPGSDPQQEVPKTAAGLPDDRFDGTDSGGAGWDTPYPPADPNAPPDPVPEGTHTGTPDQLVEPRRPTRSADGDSYEVDGPDDPAGTPQR